MVDYTTGMLKVVVPGVALACVRVNRKRNSMDVGMVSYRRSVCGFVGGGQCECEC